MADTEPEVVVAEPEPEAEEKAVKAVAYERPDDAAHKKAIAGIKEEIEILKRESSDIQARIGSKDGVKKSHRDSQEGVRRELKEVRGQRQALIKQKQGHRAVLQSIPRVNLPSKKDQPKNSVEQITEKIRRLEMKHSTESMSLKEEKDLVKEVKELKKSISGIAEFQKSIEKLKADRQSSDAKRSECIEAMKELDTQIDAIKKTEDKVSAKFDVMKTKEREESGNIPELYQQKQAKKKETDDCYDRLRKLNTEFKTDLDKWYENERVVRSEGAEARKAAYEAKKAENDAYYKAIEEEKKAEEAELGPIDPFEHEKKMCDNMLDYLQSFIATEEKVEVAAVVVDHGGLKTFGGKKVSGQDAAGWGKLAGKKKKGKKKQKQQPGHKKYIPYQLNLPLSKITALNDLDVDVPLVPEDVPAVMAAITKLKESYDSQAASGKVGKKPRAENKKVLDLKIQSKGDSEVKVVINVL